MLDALVMQNDGCLLGNKSHASVLGCADIKSHGLSAAGTRCRPFDQTVRKVGLAFTENSQRTHNLIRTLYQKLFGPKDGV